MRNEEDAVNQIMEKLITETESSNKVESNSVESNSVESNSVESNTAESNSEERNAEESTEVESTATQSATTYKCLSKFEYKLLKIRTKAKNSKLQFGLVLQSGYSGKDFNNKKVERIQLSKKYNTLKLEVKTLERELVAMQKKGVNNEVLIMHEAKLHNKKTKLSHIKLNKQGLHKSKFKS